MVLFSAMNSPPQAPLLDLLNFAVFMNDLQLTNIHYVISPVTVQKIVKAVTVVAGHKDHHKEIIDWHLSSSTDTTSTSRLH